jgi:hypothetical protein
VPVTLGAYTLFTALRLLLAYRGALRTWFLTISVVIDIVVLMITIWSFHLQYDQPPTLYLKAPTLLYVFIIIARSRSCLGYGDRAGLSISSTASAASGLHACWAHRAYRGGCRTIGADRAC